MVQGRLRGELPLKLWAAVPMSPLVPANAPQASLMFPTPCLPKAEKTRIFKLSVFKFLAFALLFRIFLIPGF